ncbi:hypothetical protein AUC61_26175 [Pseudomonas sp. S25]|uniref:Insecticidal toxin complex protein TccC n=1 Tax=Pseudomonas maioricensis TaxID=1766623 RepID=A0ABS9ZR40_9PSED|nr:hypothetical protein [Pseudomonas sp. S25]
MDGLNLFLFVSNCPISSFDSDGLQGKREKASAIESAKLHYTNHLLPNILARIEMDKQRATASLVKRTGSSSTSHIGELLETAYSALENAPMTFNITPAKLAQLTGGGMINAWKPLQKANTYTEMRDTVENQMFEYRTSHSPVTRKAASTGIHPIKAYTRPLYGALQIAEDYETVGGAPTYGATAFYLNDSARSFMTFTAADSLSTHAKIGSLAAPGNLYPLIADMRPDTWEVLHNQLSGAGKPVRVSASSNYIEWQSHAPIKWDEMKVLTFQRKTDFEKSLSTLSIVDFYKKQSISARIKRLD